VLDDIVEEVSWVPRVIFAFVNMEGPDLLLQKVYL